MADISAFGLRVTIRASSTFPGGFTISQFASDADPIASAAGDIAGTEMNLNGELNSWTIAAAVPLVINVIPGSEDDENLQILFDANKVARGRRSARDVITAVVYYPDGRRRTLTRGRLTNGSGMPGVASAGRLQSRQYTFMFEDSVGR